MDQVPFQPIAHSPSRHALQPADERWRTLGQKPAVAWFTGLSGAGKSSIANAVDRALTRRGRHSMVIDGDSLRQGLSRDLGFTSADRTENIRRAAEMARLMAEAGLVVVVALISPLREQRARARSIVSGFSFLEIFIDTPLAVCEARDPKGLYGRARAGQIQDFTGISAPYEAPHYPELYIQTEHCSVEDSAMKITDHLMLVSALSAVMK